jgi:hypothetical protein
MLKTKSPFSNIDQVGVTWAEPSAFIDANLQ